MTKKKYKEPAWVRLLKPNDIITHTRCMGSLEEHYYTGRAGIGLCGIGTKDTVMIEGFLHAEDCYANDIHPYNVTHVNRVAVDYLHVVDKEFMNMIRGFIQKSMRTRNKFFL